MKHFQPVKQQRRLYWNIADQIRSAIIEGRYPLGTMLPSELELAEVFGVSRTVIRDAITALQSRGLLDSRPGKGTFVTHPSIKTISQALASMIAVRGESILQLHQVRKALEPEIAALAANNVTEEDLKDLAQVWKAMQKSADIPEQYIFQDLNFHMAITKATHNEVFVIIIRALMDLLREGRLLVVQATHGTEISLQQHQAIFDAICNQDPEAAQAAMRAHLESVKERLIAMNN